MKLYIHPLSTYSQKVLIAFREKNVRFTPEIIAPDPESRAARAKIYPIGKIPFLVDEGRVVPESSIIVEHVERHLPDQGPRLIPADPERAEEVRLLDRIFDGCLNDPIAKVLFDALKPEALRDPDGVKEARAKLDAAYVYLDERLAGRTWAAGDAFTLADCAAAPPLGYLERFHPFAAHPRVVAYWGRLQERPSIAAVLEEARPFFAGMFGKIAA